MIDQDGVTVNYEYDITGKLARLTIGHGATLAAYTYDLAGYCQGGRTTVMAPGPPTTTTWPDRSRIWSTMPDGTVNSRFDYTYDPPAAARHHDHLDGGWAYTYDPTGQLTHAVFTSANPAIPNRDEQYEYDAVGNRVRTVVNG
ncbi:MAG: hypothetical protein U0736_10295 [Gemmataceae bacterium]